ncbi:MAG: OB-fold domain-containing protein [Dehalococcoidia bacterium]|jgi:hypothetical protein|nr:OB-fold domain-containing protein [Dehalococcoidia bacterium]
MPNRPQPRFPEPNTETYWEGAKNGELKYQQCSQCDEVVFTPRVHCTKCGSDDLAWKTSKGEGSVYTYSVIRQTRHPQFVDLGAYALAYVDLDEGFRIFTNVSGIDDPTKDIECGMRVKVEFEQQDDGEYPIPVFVPV